jgi:hypothetical protein
LRKDIAFPQKNPLFKDVVEEWLEHKKPKEEE